MTKQLIFCLMVVLLFATAGLSQSRRKGPIRKSATVYYQSEESGSYTGTIHFKLNGKAVDFTWWRELTRWYNINDNPRARKVGAEWQIVYESCNDPECRKLVSARFTGRTDTSSPTVPSEGAITQGVRTISTPTGTWDD